MLAEFLTKLEQMAQRSQGVQVGSVPGVPDRSFVRNGDKIEWIDSPPPKRAHIIHGLEDVIGIVLDPIMTGSSGAEVFHSSDKIVVILDRKTRREKIVMPLVNTERWGTLTTLRALPHGFEVGQAIRLIRFDLQGVGADSLVSALKRIDFTRKGSGATTIEHGKESMGRSVEAAVQQADQVPDSFTAEVQMFSNSGLKGIHPPVKCGIYLDVNAEKIVIRPLADEIATAVETAQRQIHELLVKELGSVPVYHGEPVLV